LRVISERKIKRICGFRRKAPMTFWILRPSFAIYYAIILHANEEAPDEERGECRFLLS
jgi:hypothetical protein